MEKLQVLMELHPCFYGFAGIPQETRLLFSYFLELPQVHATGLLSADVPTVSFRTTRQNPHQTVNHLSQFIIATLDPVGMSFMEKGKVAINLFRTSVKNMLGLSIPMAYFHAKGFEDFLWEQLFSKTLNVDEFERITSALFRCISFSRHTLYMMKCRSLFPKIATRGYDVLFVQTPFPGRVDRKTQLVIRYHDAVPLFVPHLIDHPKPHQASHYQALCANAKTGIFICTSEAVRHDLLYTFPTLETRSEVIHDSISPHYFEESTTMRHLTEIIRQYADSSRRAMGGSEDSEEAFYQSHLSDPNLRYVMMVSTIEPRKNQIRLIRAWELACRQLKRPVKLILVGDLGWQVEPILTAMRPWQRRGDLFHLQKVPIESLRLLYQGAACVVCPSVKEGFDLSGIEAMACGGKVVASDIPVHREIYGQGALYFDPYSAEKQADTIASLLVPNNERAPLLREQGLLQAKRYQKKTIQPQWDHFFEQLRLSRAMSGAF